MASGFPGIVRSNPDGSFSLIYTPAPDQYLADIAEDAQGALYFADSQHRQVYRFARGSFQTIAGTGMAGYNGDGRTAVSAQLNRPTAVDVDRNQNVFILDAGNRRVRDQ